MGRQANRDLEGVLDVLQQGRLDRFRRHRLQGYFGLAGNNTNKYAGRVRGAEDNGQLGRTRTNTGMGVRSREPSHRDRQHWDNVFFY